MEKFVAPNGKKMPIYEGRVITFGLSSEQNEFVSNNMPSSHYELYETDCVTDIMAVHSIATIIMASAFQENELELITEYYLDIINQTDETVFWIGYPKPLNPLRIKFKCYENFDELALNLKYLLLTAHTKHKKIKSFSKKLADSLMILSMMRNRPGIKTSELASITEMSERSVQRYISTLQATGEWIEYDSVKRGWRLMENVSILFGDHLKD